MFSVILKKHISQGKSAIRVLGKSTPFWPEGRNVRSTRCAGRVLGSKSIQFLPQRKPRSDLIIFNITKSKPHLSPFILFLRADEHLKVTTFRDRNVIRSPLAGLRPLRSRLSLTQNLPNPVIRTSSPDSRVDLTISTKDSTSSMDLSLEYPQWLRMLSIIRSLVRVKKILQFFPKRISPNFASCQWFSILRKRHRSKGPIQISLVHVGDLQTLTWIEIPHG
jgi:hypothetical protein